MQERILELYDRLRRAVAAGLAVDTTALRSMVVADRDQLAALIADCAQAGEPFDAGHQLLAVDDGLLAAVDALDRGDATAAALAAAQGLHEGFAR